MTLCNLFPPHWATSIPRFDSCQVGYNSSSFFTTKRRIPESKRVRTMLNLLFPNCVPRCHRALQQIWGAPWIILNVSRETWLSLDIALTMFMVIHGFNIGLCYISSDDVMSLQNWVFIHCCDKNQIEYTAQRGAGSEGGGVQSDSVVWEVAQCSTGTCTHYWVTIVIWEWNKMLSFSFNLRALLKKKHSC